MNPCCIRLVVASVALASCTGQTRATPPAGPQKREPAPASAEPVAARARFVAPRPADRVLALEAAGRLLAPPNARAELTMPVAAQVLRVRTSEGQHVERGQVVVELAVPEAARAAGQLEGARLRIAAYRARLDQLELLRGEGLARGQELAEARARLAEAQASEREALAFSQTMESLGLRRQGNHYELVAPLSGTVVAVHAPLGSVRGPADGALFEIVGGAPTRVEARFAFALPERAEYRLLARDGEPIALRLIAQSPEVTQEDASRRAWFEAAQPIALPLGSPVRVRMLAKPGSWVVPESALVEKDGRRGLRTQRAAFVPVTLIARLGSEALVAAELSPDDRLAEEGTPAP